LLQRATPPPPPDLQALITESGEPDPKENDMTEDDKDTINNENDTTDTANAASDSGEELTEAELDQVAGGEKVQFGSSS
jgi:hypothetical protein